MFDIGWSELLVIAGVALVVLGPKELPGALRTVTGFARKARSVVREFQGHVDEMVKEAELSELRKQIEKETGAEELRREVEAATAPIEEAREAVRIDPPQMGPPEPYPSSGAIAPPTERKPV
jgi:sec-independent protein translocase protein TatB